ncbi:MAG: hypothetical protein NTY09_07035 [bacterium]|nr:hypothetical protein [bacterium]
MLPAHDGLHYWLIPSPLPYNYIVPKQLKETLDQFRERVSKIEKPTQTSPLYAKLGWPMLGLGLVFLLFDFFAPGSYFILSFLGSLGVLGGIGALAMSYISEHSEGVEGRERDKLIRERSATSRCLYLEGKVPEGKGTMGRCRLYEFDMADYPYCIHCKEYTSPKGNPNV